ncbi:minor capsid protein [Thermomonospora cellulosilytica]|uniref:Uncharacterized protein n=1 Tax=Thermomonospora cellulosilytica TaxID=1411118 RepID=A0A7W3R7Z3_9ACTN|nr:minor capsid protein [Thermomonospora cellulosilytica]MBA9003733.1 hypothetical protein [Thermomonospora cellulosilytica]
MTLLEEFARLLELRGLGEYHEDGSAGGSIFLAALPSSPDRCKAIALYGGGDADSRLAYDEPSLQVRCRGTTDPRTAEADAQQVYDALHGLGMLTLPGGTWLQLMLAKQSGPVYIGRDVNGRHEWTVNLQAEISRPTPHRV